MKEILLRWSDALASLVVVGWFVLPVTLTPEGPATGLALVNWASAHPDLLGAWLSATWLLPLYPVFRWVALFLPRTAGDWARSQGWSAALSRLAASGLLVAGLAAPFLAWGDRDSWFAALPPEGPWLLAGALGLVLWATSDLLGLTARQDPLDQTQDTVPGRSRVSSALEKLSRIRSKLLAAFMALMTLVVVTLSAVLLSNYEGSLLKAVADGARSQVLQATSVYKANIGDGADIAMFEFLNTQDRINARAAIPFRSFAFHTNLQSRYLTDVPDREPLPRLATEYTSEVPDTRYPEGRDLAPEAVRALLDDPGNGVRDARGTISWGAPIVVNEFQTADSGERVRHLRLLGMAVITFDVEDVLAPYVLTRTTVIVLTLVFLYLAGILVYLVGSFIVTPLLHLRHNVRTVSDSLQTMVRGQGRVSAANLRFDQVVRTRDEIEHLSGEIGNMVTVIKGIIPYISASTLRQAETGAALSQSKELTFLFTDIRGFTTLCEGMAPEEVVTLLNGYLDLETEIILANHGDVDKFVGDEVMAFFDGPEKERNACKAALQIREAMDREAQRRLSLGLPVVDIGIGIHTGPVVFGSVGARDRMDFTSIGDPVNLAARLEGANKAYGSRIIVSELVYRRVERHFVCRELDAIAVKGKNEPIRIFELFEGSEAATEAQRHLARDFQTALEAYRRQNWEAAEAGFAAHQALDGPSRVFWDRVRRFREAPPATGWDGVYRMETK